jgi:hypothetical protein
MPSQEHIDKRIQEVTTEATTLGVLDKITPLIAELKTALDAQKFNPLAAEIQGLLNSAPKPITPRINCHTLNHFQQIERQAPKALQYIMRECYKAKGTEWSQKTISSTIGNKTVEICPNKNADGWVIVIATNDYPSYANQHYCVFPDFCIKRENDPKQMSEDALCELLSQFFLRELN